MSDEMVVLDAADFGWDEPEMHVRAYSKCLVTRETVPGASFDFRISRYPVSGRNESHSHESAEQLFYIISGTGTARSGGVRHRLSPGITLYVPPRVDHAIENTGDEDLVFAIVTTEPLVG
ncbi:cupin domain-containing protein [Nocardioides humi]|uniref:Cupin type-2 domain-containing protein n=1 Tax=Nocardioides humi TaxID=449461 RepID=A0ABN2AET7_9ACTN|nr:cupin domain-containing protein [Nocardioides humi]